MHVLFSDRIFTLLVSPSVNCVCANYVCDNFVAYTLKRDCRKAASLVACYMEVKWESVKLMNDQALLVFFLK